MPVKVLIVDDSTLIRQILSDMLKDEPELSVVGTASDGEDALEKIKTLQPDVVTLDIEMPRMNGLDCLTQIMKNDPTPVIIVSYLTLKGAEISVKALELGAVDFVTKPTPHDVDVDVFENIKQELTQKIRVASEINLKKLKFGATLPEKDISQEKKLILSSSPNLNFDLVAIGASTGGPKALFNLLTQLPKKFPLGVVIGQHMPKNFTNIFAKRLNQHCEVEVAEARMGDVVEPGKVFIVPAGYQTKVLRYKQSLILEISEEPKLILKPSIDYLFKSIAESCQGRVLSILLTGMGADGAAGMKQLRDLGARTIAQNEASCIVYGMPKVAVQMGGVEFVEDILNIYPKMVDILNEP